MKHSTVLKGLTAYMIPHPSFECIDATFVAKTSSWWVKDRKNWWWWWCRSTKTWKISCYGPY